MIKTIHNITKEVIAIRISVNDELKVVQFWCTEDEANISFDKIDIPFEKYRKVIYRSGKSDLNDLTAAIVKHNIKSPTVQA